MRTGSCLAILLLLNILSSSACAPRQLRPIATIDHTPLLEAVQERRSILETGLSGTLEMDFKGGERRFRGKSYIVAYPGGRFRLEIPGPWGSTYLVMTCDGREVLAYYPEEGKAFRSLAEGRSVNPHLPFPLPVDPIMIPALFMGVFPDGGEVSKASASLMDSGVKSLRAGWGDTQLQFHYLFAKGSDSVLTEVTAHEKDMRLIVHTGENPPYLPRDFSLTFPDASLKGQWRQAALFKGSEADLELRIPGHVTVIDLEEMP
ncbi:MAG: hypothetical protein RRA32_05825 [bacterium]|nr:hypothetical protein [bacterium]